MKKLLIAVLSMTFAFSAFAVTVVEISGVSPANPKLKVIKYPQTTIEVIVSSTGSSRNITKNAGKVSATQLEVAAQLGSVDATAMDAWMKLTTDGQSNHKKSLSIIFKDKRNREFKRINGFDCFISKRSLNATSAKYTIEITSME